MHTHFYLSFSPIEALIASQLEPHQFGSYMAIGAKNGSHERIMFFELTGEFGTYFDWAYARKRCVAHADGSPKHSVWVSVYRVLEHVPLEAIGSLYLTTADGRSLEIKPGSTVPEEKRPYWVYQELCPITPLVVSALAPREFARSMTDPANHVQVPMLVFSDLKTVDFADPTRTGNIGSAYDRNLEHLKECVQAVTTLPDKPNKNVERSVNAFSYQIIGQGIYVGNGNDLAAYPMPDQAQIRQNHYDWGRSAMLF